MTDRGKCVCVCWGGDGRRKGGKKSEEKKGVRNRRRVKKPKMGEKQGSDQERSKEEKSE